MQDKQPVFVCGLARSGTSWITQALGQSYELVYIGESWMIAKLADLRKWCDHIQENYKFNTFTWKDYSTDNKFFVKSIGNFYKDLLYNVSGGKRFIEKTPNWNLENIELLGEFFPDAYFVVIYRDGRNQVASYEIFSEKKKNRLFDFRKNCSLWAKSMDKITLIKDNSVLSRYILIKYEDLLSNFDNKFNELCDFAEIKRFKPHTIDSNSSYADSAKNDSDYNSRWHSWNDDKKSIFKELAGKHLIEWGYAQSNETW